jgi:hypothetical protein
MMLGTGKMLWGQADRDRTDRSHTATLWFTVLFLPLFPIKSIRIKRTEDDPANPKIQQYKEIARVPLHVKQVIRTYLIAYTIAFLIIITIRYYTLQLIHLF